MPRSIIPFPQELRPRLPTIVGNVDYQTLRQRLEQIDALLRQGGVERDFVERALEGWMRGASREPTALEEGKFDGLLKAAIEQPSKLGLKEALDLEAYFLDSTCLRANIHFPTDWVLLRDGVRTLMKATLLIRQAGLRSRMQAPEEFLRRMNRLSIQMTQQARRAGSKKGSPPIAASTDALFMLWLK